MVFVLNLIAEYYDTTHALHLSTIFKMFAIWLFVSFPLTVVGTMFGRHWAGKGKPSPTHPPTHSFIQSINQSIIHPSILLFVH